MAIFQQRLQRVGGLLGARNRAAAEQAAKAETDRFRGLDGFGFDDMARKKERARKTEKAGPQAAEQPLQERHQPQATDETHTAAPNNEKTPATSGQEPGPASTRVAGDGKVPDAGSGGSGTSQPASEGDAAMPTRKNDLFPTATPTGAKKSASKFDSALQLARTHVRLPRTGT